MKIIIVIPVYNDWDSAGQLCALLDPLLEASGLTQCSILLVDDGSTTAPAPLFLLQRLRTIRDVRILHLRRNLGHQRAIAVALGYVEHQESCDAIVIMDGDGEDRPEDVPRLVSRLTASPATPVVFAERGRRLEGLVFRTFYFVYRLLHRLLTGNRIRFGNFSAIRFSVVGRLTRMPELWSHYAATVVNAKLPYATVRTDRGRRLHGDSKMNLEALILHGLAAIAVYHAVSIRLLIASGVLAGFLVAATVTAVAVSALASTALSTWVVGVLGISLVLLIVMTFTSLLYAFLSIGFRNILGTLPTRDYVYFVDRCEVVFET